VAAFSCTPIRRFRSQQGLEVEPALTRARDRLISGQSDLANEPDPQLGVSHMVLLGLLLVLVAAAAVTQVSVSDATGTMPVTIWERTVDLTPAELFAAGAVSAAVFLAGILLIFVGLRRSAVKRRRKREARLAERDRVSRLEAEKRDLERRLESTETPPAKDGARQSAADGDRDHVHGRDDDPAATRTGRHEIQVPSQVNPDHLVAGGRRSGGVDDPANRV
jgi:hypothetical protein